MIYWDTSCVLMLYVAEPDSRHWEHMAITSEDQFATSALFKAELACALHRMEQRHDVIAGGADVLLSAFDEDDAPELPENGHDG